MSNQTITQSAFDKLIPTEQVALLKANVHIIDDKPEPSVTEGQISFEDNDDYEVEVNDPSVKVETDFEISGDSVYLNIIIVIGSDRFKVKSIKLTEKRQCLDRWDKDKKQWTSENSDVMSLINMVRTHGAKAVNQFMTVEASFGKSGERANNVRDPLAALLALKEE